MERSLPASQMALALERFGDGIQVLSLDCFDTLLWRSTHAPVDVFSELACGPRVRGAAESLQRQTRHLLSGSYEVRLREIQARVSPQASSAELDTLVSDELLAEHSHCFGFAATVALIERAHSQGLKVIVVSDTYLEQAQLRQLIRHAAGEAVSDMIDAIYCSCEYGVSKAAGLFRPVLKALGVAAQAVLHLGDNPVADYEAAQALGIRSVHVEQFPADLEQRLRMEAAIGQVMDPRLKVDRPLVQLHRAPLAMGWAAQSSAAARVGYGTLAPLLVAYGRWLQSELERLAVRLTRERVRPLFLMRDGYMPLKVFDKLPGSAAWGARSIELSRFCAFAASFTGEAAILEYLAEFGVTQRFDAVSGQLLFNLHETEALVRAARSTDPLAAFTEQILKPANLRKIQSRSSAFTDRMCTYLRDHADVEPGQTLVFADLGYAGTIQDRVGPILQERMGLHIEGRYLLLRDVAGWRQGKAGLFGPDHYDYRLLESLASYIAIVEQLCTIEQESCVDYSHEGIPIRKKSDLKAHQNARRAQAQTACLNYADSWRQAFARQPDASGVDEYRTSALQILSRLLFMPSPEETELFNGFEHDVNLGVNDKVTLFDPKAAHDGLLRRGLFYTNNNPRQYLPAEVRELGMDLSLNVLLLRRYSPDIRQPDFHVRALPLAIMIADENKVMENQIEAVPTYDGYYLASIPIGRNQYSIGLKFGIGFEWIQLHSIDALPLGHLMTNSEDVHRQVLTESALYEGMTVHAQGLLHCQSAESFLFVPPPAIRTDDPWVLNVVFRPIAERVPRAETARSAAAARQENSDSLLTRVQP